MDRVAFPFCKIELTTSNPMLPVFLENPTTHGEHIRKRRLDLGWTQKRTATELGVSEDTLRDWELGNMEPKPRKLPRIGEFLGYQPDSERFDAPHLIGRILSVGALTLDRLAAEIGVCEDTLVNLQNGRYQPARRTYDKLVDFASKLEIRRDPCRQKPSQKSSSQRRKDCGTKSTCSRSASP